MQDTADVGDRLVLLATMLADGAISATINAVTPDNSVHSDHEQTNMCATASLDELLQHTSENEILAVREKSNHKVANTVQLLKVDKGISVRARECSEDLVILRRVFRESHCLFCDVNSLLLKRLGPLSSGHDWDHVLQNPYEG